MAENIQQALQMTTTNAQLAVLPTFSNDPKEDKSSAIKLLQKLLNNKQGVR
jgi:N12 class adenine-specific DNA methylase